MDEEERLPTTLDAGLITRFFHLSNEDLREVRRGRGDVSRIGYALQLCVLRWRGHFLKDPRQVPWEVLEHVANQLGLLALPLQDYLLPEDTRVHQRERLCQYLGFRRCGVAERQQLLENLIEQAQISPKDTTLRASAGMWLTENRVVRPGRSTLIDLIQTARERGLQRVYERLTDALTQQQRETLEALLTVDEQTGRSPLENLKAPARQESPDAILALLDRLQAVKSLGVADVSSLRSVHPAIRQALASQGYRHEVWTLRRFPYAKRLAIVLCFVQASRAEITDAIIEMQDKLILRQHAKAKARRLETIQAGEQVRKEALAAAETVFGVLLDESVEDGNLRPSIFSKLPEEKLRTLVTGCQYLSKGGSNHLGFLEPAYPYIRRYSPQLLESMPFSFTENSDLGSAVELLTQMNHSGRRKLDTDAPTTFLPSRWKELVETEDGQLSRPHYELAVLTCLNEGLKSGDVTVAGSRRFTDFEDYLIPKATWETEREKHYQRLGLPLNVEEFLTLLGTRLAEVTQGVEKRVARNASLTIDANKGKFHLAALKGEEQPASAKELRNLLQSRMSRIDLVDLLIDMDNETNFLQHFLNAGDSGKAVADTPQQRRNLIAALIAVGCNIGPQRMAGASGIGFREITQIADWHFTEGNLKAASVGLVNFAAALPLSHFWGQGDTCSADGMRFHVPVNILSADYSSRLGARGVTLMAHTSDNYLRLYHRPIPCRLRESTFSLDGLMEHESELDPKTCYTDTHGFTEVVMATAALQGFDLAPRIRDVKDQTLYKMDRSLHYTNLDSILTGTIQTYKIRTAWDEVVRIMASIHARRVSPSLILHRLGSYARKNSIHQALAEIGRVYKTIFILTYIDDEALRRHIGRELNKGEASHQLSRFLCFGKDGTIRGREFEDQVSTFSCLAVLHNAVVAWNTRQMELLIQKLRVEGHTINDADLAHIAPLMRRHINPFGRYHFDLARIRQVRG